MPDSTVFREGPAPGSRDTGAQAPATTGQARDSVPGEGTAPPSGCQFYFILKKYKRASNLGQVRREPFSQVLFSYVACLTCYHLGGRTERRRDPRETRPPLPALRLWAGDEPGPLVHSVLGSRTSFLLRLWFSRDWQLQLNVSFEGFRRN